jgi:hypothetical protein
MNTPRTDQNTGFYCGNGIKKNADLYLDPEGPFVLAEFARELERENARISEGLDRLIHGLKAMTRCGVGPCGGGGCLDLYSQGQAEAESRMRKELRRFLKEFDLAKVEAEAGVKTKSNTLPSSPPSDSNDLTEGMKRFAKKWFGSDEL